MRRATRTRASPAYPASRPDWGRCDASRNGRRGRGKRVRWTWTEGSDLSSLPDVLLVRLAREQLIDVRRVLHLELDHPARGVRIAVHERRIALEGRVYLGDRARHRRVQVRDGLHRLDGAEHVPARELMRILQQVPMIGTCWSMR